MWVWFLFELPFILLIFYSLIRSASEEIVGLLAVFEHVGEVLAVLDVIAVGKAAAEVVHLDLARVVLLLLLLLGSMFLLGWLAV